MPQRNPNTTDVPTLTFVQAPDGPETFNVLDADALARFLSKVNQYDSLHSCDNRSCINPAHLRWGTPADNMADRRLRNRAPAGASHPNAKLSASQVADIRSAYKAGVQRRALSNAYEVTYQAIHAIVKGINWSTS